jgi:hypothetical protein
MAKIPKVQRSYKLAPHIADCIEQLAYSYNHSQAEIVENAVTWYANRLGFNITPVDPLQQIINNTNTNTNININRNLQNNQAVDDGPEEVDLSNA